MTLLPFVALALLGVPLFVVLGAAALVATRDAQLDSALLMVEFARLAASPNLVAIPLFVLAGATMGHGGAGRRLVRFFNALLGWMPAGIAWVAAASCMLFTAFSGASGVTILALGGLLYPMLKDEGYPERFALGLISSGGSMGLLLPPSLAVLLYGVVAQVDIGDLFVAGLLPTLLLFVMVGSYAVRRGARGAPRHRFRWRELAAAARAGWADLLLPIGVVAGLAAGLLTVAELAACSALYALVLETVVHRTIRAKELAWVGYEAATLVGSIFVILGLSLGLTNLLVDAQVPMRLLDWVVEQVHSPLAFLLWMNAVLLVVGCMMDIFSAIVIVTPLLLPLATHFGIHPLHLGIVVLANLEIGYLTPPVGINLYLASQRFKQPVLTVFRATLPFLLLLLVWLLLLTYVPALSLWNQGMHGAAAQLPL
ncbi:TRAP dicarboxylate transporter, DctM subunit [Thiobacillus denitrificans ATCC 25259]|uniref:TRAP transporter large permease protein n=1 Tax=Thiobacillus denitrificans (strain ATCC 25259 / T1) TaxID=292415 RepID=Q3SLI9_THIDA|nr:TRAP transporter large permease [Thiobacillus denitrificans]AAZ96421.1 TRAP dicarboxylate transporter, DctM subunit [Thiobacillus denitrificans ATCC 25259]